MKSILDRSFRYTSSAATDLKKTFERIRREERRRLMAQTLPDAPARAGHSTIRQQAERGCKVLTPTGS